MGKISLTLQSTHLYQICFLFIILCHGAVVVSPGVLIYLGLAIALIVQIDTVIAGKYL